MCVQRDERILGAQLLGGYFGFGAAHIGGGVEHLPLEVALVHGIEIEQAQGAHAGGGQVLQHRAAQAAAAHYQHAGGLQALLARQADFGQQQVPAVAVGFGGGKWSSSWGHQAVRLGQAKQLAGASGPARLQFRALAGIGPVAVSGPLPRRVQNTLLVLGLLPSYICQIT